MNFKKIIACVDGSEASPLVIRQGLDWAAREGAESLEILHVVDVKIEYPVLAAEFQEAADPRGEVEAKVLAKVDEMVRANLEGAQPIPWTVKIITGRPYEVITRRAEEEKADLIVMGHRRLSGWERFLLGSVASKVVPYAPCHVLVARPGLEKVGKVLVALDGTDESRSVAAFGLAQARLLGAGAERRHRRADTPAHLLSSSGTHESSPLPGHPAALRPSPGLVLSQGIPVPVSSPLRGTAEKAPSPARDRAAHRLHLQLAGRAGNRNRSTGSQVLLGDVVDDVQRCLLDAIADRFLHRRAPVRFQAHR